MQKSCLGEHLFMNLNPSRKQPLHKMTLSYTASNFQELRYTSFFVYT